MEVAVIELFSKTLLVGVNSALFRGVAFLTCVDSEWRPATDDAGSAAALMVERRALLGLMGLLSLPGAGPVELLTLRFIEESRLPEEKCRNYYLVPKCTAVLWRA